MPRYQIGIQSLTAVLMSTGSPSILEKREFADFVSQVFYLFKSHAAIHSIKLQCMDRTKEIKPHFLPAPVKQHPQSSDAGQKNICS